MKVYIAGNIGAGLPEEVFQRFREAKQRIEALGVEVLDPTRGKAVSGEEVGFPYEANEIVHRDEADIDAADVLIARIEQPSIGTSMEIYRAREICHIPVIVVTSSHLVANHYWIRAKATKIVRTLEEAAEYMRGWYL